jgi:class 3 adenylate cyclase
VGHFAGDGLMLFFNDPVRCEDPAGKAVAMAVTLNDHVHDQLQSWRRRGHDLGFGTGIDLGYATLGRTGFEGRYDYGAIGNVVNLASRLCDEAKDGQVLISQRAYAAVEDRVEAEDVGMLMLKGFERPMMAWNVTSVAGLSEPPGP